MQEALSTKRFGVDQQQFPCLQALNGVQSLACFLWAGLLLLVIGTGRKGPMPPMWAYWKPGLTNAIGPACGYEALKNISYPAQMGHLACFTQRSGHQRIAVSTSSAYTPVLAIAAAGCTHVMTTFH